MWQVALILDHLQNDSIGAARDGTALLAVCLELSALMDIGLLLALQEGVHQSQLGGLCKRKGYIKELVDLIVSKRNDISQAGEGGSTPKSTQKEIGRKKSDAQEEGEQ